MMNLRLFDCRKMSLLCILTLFEFTPVYSQVALKAEYEGEYYIISADSKGYGVYSVLLDIYKAENYGGPQKRVVTVAAAPREILRLKRENPNEGGSVGYRYWYLEGIAETRRDTGFIYRLPYSACKNTVRGAYTYNVREKYAIGKTPPFPLISIYFYMDRGDTVYAARKGKVTRIEDKYTTSSNPELSFSSEVNGITVQHDDGTTASYSGIEKGGFLVTEGEVVYPYTPIAIVGSFDGEKYGFYFNVGYPALTGDDTRPWGRRFYKPVFATQAGERFLQNNTVNIAKVDEELILREMNNREKKNYEKNRSSLPVKK